MLLWIAIVGGGVAVGDEPSAMQTIEPQRSTIELPTSLENACVGGRGRFLVARLTGRREIVVLDLVRQLVVFTVPLGEDVVEFTAGETELHIVAPESSLFQSWSLRTGARLREVAWPISGYVKRIAMGSDHRQRLFACFADSPHQAEPNRWATIELPSMKVDVLTIAGDPPIANYHLKSSAKGEMAVAWTQGSDTRNRGVVLIQGQGARWLSWPIVPDQIMLNESGSHLYTELGVHQNTLEEDVEIEVQDSARCVPAVTGPMYLTHRVGDDTSTWTLRSIDQRSPLATIPFGGDLGEDVFDSEGDLGQRMFFSAEFGCIAVLTDGPEIAIYQFDLSSVAGASIDLAP